MRMTRMDHRDILMVLSTSLILARPFFSDYNKSKGNETK